MDFVKQERMVCLRRLGYSASLSQLRAMSYLERLGMRFLQHFGVNNCVELAREERRKASAKARKARAK